MAEPKSQRVNLRISASDDALLRRAAKEESKTLSEFLISTARLHAEMLLADRTYFELNDENWNAFNAMLNRPARVSPALVELFQRPRPE